MKKAWPWIVGIVVGLVLIGMIAFDRSSRQAYRIARGAINDRVGISQDRIDMAVEMATKSVDLALAQAGNLPSQQAAADLIKQDIQEIGNRLKEASQAHGEAAIQQLNQSIDQFNKAMQTVDDASKQADSPEVKSTLDRIYGILEATKEQITQAVLNAQASQ
jgi:hypothetical protein